MPEMTAEERIEVSEALVNRLPGYLITKNGARSFHYRDAVSAASRPCGGKDVLICDLCEALLAARREGEADVEDNHD